MNQIAIGDDHKGWTVIHGQSVTAPFTSSAMFFVGRPEEILQEKVAIYLSGSPTEISNALTALESIRLRSMEYALGAYPYPQYLRFQPTTEIKYFYTPISEIYFAIHPTGYFTRETGSATVEMHYQRPNYFEGAYQLLTVTDTAGVDHSPTIDLVNHIDGGAGLSNTFLVKPTVFSTELPAALRLQITNTYAIGEIQDFMIGIYHHPTVTGHRFFYALYNDMTGGSVVADGAAIGGYYRSHTWTASGFTTLFNFAISAADVHDFDGRWYRPVVHLFSPHAYSDLYLRMEIVRGTDILEVGEPVFADPNYQYLLFPPVQIPPNAMLRETLPHSVDLEIEAIRISGAATTLNIDQILLLPLDPSLNLLGFFGMGQNDTLVYDASRDLQNVRYSAAELETVAHIMKGSPLTLYPGEYNRVFLLMANTSNQIDIDRTVTLRAMYRERVRFI
jgi:hypothetical protein